MVDEEKKSIPQSLQRIQVALSPSLCPVPIPVPAEPPVPIPLTP